MGLIDRFTALFQKLAPTTGRTTSDELAKPQRPTELVESFTIGTSRREVVEICRRMYDEDPRVDRVLKTLGSDAVRGGFTVKVVEGERAEEAEAEASALKERLGLTQRLDDWARLSFRDGESFLELSADGEGLIQQMTRKPTLEMNRNSDATDRFADPARAYWWADAMYGSLGPPPDAVWFAEWQIIHCRYNHDEGSRYGRPQFASARGPWKRVTEGELDIAIRRKTRAGMKFLHVLEDASPADLEAYKQQNQDVLNNPFAAIADFFSNRKGSISVVQGDANLAEIADVMHHIRTFWMASPVPMSLVGYGQDLNRDVLEKQKEQYDEALPGITGWIEDQIVKPLLKRQWLLRGIWPGSLKYQVEWATKQALTAKVLEAVANALIKLRATQLFGDEDLIRLAAQMLPGVDPVALLAALEKRKAAAPPPDEIVRMAALGNVPPSPRPSPSEGEGGRIAVGGNGAGAR